MANSIVRRVSNRHALRTASAAMELVFVLPFILALLLIIMTIAAITMTRMGLVTTVRNDAWQGRHEPWRQSPDYAPQMLHMTVPAETQRILGPTQRWPTTAAVTSRGERAAPVYLRGWQNTFAPVAYEHMVLAGSWDYQEIAFETRARHRQLVPTHKVYFFHDGPVSFAPFRQLADFASPASLADQEAARREQERQHASQQEELARRRQEIVAALARTRQQISVLREQLAQRERQEPRDENAIRQIGEQIARLESQIRALEEALNAIDQVGRAAPR